MDNSIVTTCGNLTAQHRRDCTILRFYGMMRRYASRPQRSRCSWQNALTMRSLPETGRRFGGRDHSTLLHAVRKSEGLCSADSALREELELLKRMLQE